MEPRSRFPDEFGELQILAETPEDFPGMSPTAVFGVLVPAPPHDLSLDALKEDLRAIALAEEASYGVEISDSETHWGASGAFTTVMLYLGARVLEMGVEGALRALVRRVLVRSGDVPERTLTPEQAAEYASWFTGATYSNSAPFDVGSRTWDEDAGRWEFRLTSGAIETTTTVELFEGLPLVRVARTTEFDWEHADATREFMRR